MSEAKVRVLVVDDDRAVRDSLRRSLAFNGYEVDTAGGGVEGLEHVTSHTPAARGLPVHRAARGGPRRVEAGGRWVGDLPAAAGRRRRPADPGADRARLGRR